MKELTLKQITNKLRCIFSKLTKLEQRTFEQVNADWNATSGPAQILNKPNLSNEPKIYSVLVTQSGTSAPTIEILNKNFTETINSIYAAPGQYFILSPDNLFLDNKTEVIFTSSNPNYIVAAFQSGAGGIGLNVKNLSGTLVNDALNKAFLKITIYP